MTPPRDDELVQHARALRGLARALVGGEHADDVLQDASMQVLRRQPGSGVPLFGWLLGVLRHRAAKHHRSERRRAAREQRAGERTETVSSPTPLDAAVHRETVARLDAALLALPQPYQDTLLWRYYQDLSPTDIAARTGVPVATVKSRLQRGLSLLRERLDGDERRGEGDRGDGPRSDWRAAFSLAFGLGDAPIGGTVAVAAGVGITLMMAKLAVAAALAVLVGFWLWPRDERPVVDATAAIAADRTPAAVADPQAPVVEVLGPRQPATPTTGTPPTAAPLGRDVTWVGRCVDEVGVPLADVGVQGRLQPTGGGHTLAERELRSAADGTFTMVLPIVEGGIVSLQLRTDGRCPLEGSIHDAVAGERRDFGDLVLPTARRVRGRVVDTAGVPQAGVVLQLYRDRSGETRRILETPTQSGAETDAAGSFVVEDDLPAGMYSIQVRRREFAAGTSRVFELAGDVHEHGLDLVVQPPVAPCRGIVVNRDGGPIAGADVDLDDDSTVTGADGRFELTPSGGSETRERRLVVQANGYLKRNDVRWVLGDAKELRIELQAAPAIVVRVVDGSSGVPIERFTVRTERPNAWEIQRERGPSVHPGGIARVAADPGAWWVLVTADDTRYAPSAFVPVDVPKDHDAMVTVSLWPEQQRRLVLRDGHGPAAGVDVELLDAGDVQVRRNTETWPLDGSRVGGLPMARIVQRGTTDADGALVLRGPKGDLALRLSGGDLALQIVQPVRLDTPSDLVVTAQRGARVRGRLVPIEVVRHLLAASQVGPNDEPVRVGIELADADGVSLRRHLEPPFPLDAEGRFDVRGVPAGTCHIVVATGLRRFGALAIDVPAGGEVEREVDVSALAPASVTLRLLVDGEPARHAFVNAMGWHARSSFGARFPSQTMGHTDALGTMRIETYIGDVELHVQWPGAAERVRTRLQVLRAGPQEQVVDLRIGSLDLRLLRPDGGPAADLEMRVLGTLVSWPWQSDPSGRVRIESLVAGSYELEARPRSLSTPASQQAYQQANGWEALAREWVPIGSILVVPGSAAPQRLVLPAAWDR